MFAKIFTQYTLIHFTFNNTSLEAFALNLITDNPHYLDINYESETIVTWSQEGC